MVSTQSDRVFKGIADVPGPRGYPVLGNVLSLLPNPLPYIKELHRLHGNIFHVNFAFNKRHVFLLGPQALDLVLTNSGQMFSNKLGYKDQAKLLGEKSLLLRDGVDHRAIRRSLNFAFKAESLKSYIEIMNESVQQQVDRWLDTLLAGGATDFLAGDIKQLSLNIAARVLCGIELNDKSEELNRHFLNLLNAMVSISPNLPGTATRSGHNSRAFLDNFFRSQINQRKSSVSTDLFTAICQSADELSDDEIVDNMIGILVAAYETTSGTISMMLTALAEHPEWQVRILEEAGERESTASGPSGFDPLELVMKETLRLYTPLSFLPRQAIKAFEFEGYRFPANTMVMVSPGFVHHMPSIYPNPALFDPERFSRLRAEDKAHACAWSPFGRGAHMCMGIHFASLEIRAFFNHLLPKFSIEKRPSQSIDLKYMPVLGPKGSTLAVNLRPRA